jgi:hypothetical protein
MISRRKIFWQCTGVKKNKPFVYKTMAEINNNPIHPDSCPFGMSIEQSEKNELAQTGRVTHM